MNLNDVNEGIKKHRRRKRLGRGTGSGLGKTSGRGHKGQRSRAGASFHPQFQGGAMPMFRRVPKRGFNNKFAVTVLAVNIGQLEHLFADGDQVNPETLAKTAIGKSRYDVLKILGDGELTKKLTISAHRFSQSAREKIEKAGGTIVELPGKKPVVKNKQKSASS
ncbi:MAG: 50S ribosomal protein L15 [Pirellulaceae bacterium]